MENLGFMLGTNNTSSTSRQANSGESKMTLPSTSTVTGITSLINAFRRMRLEMVVAIRSMSINRCFYPS